MLTANRRGGAQSITAIKESRMLAWRSHIDGAVNLVKTRGREQLCRTRTGTLLFSAVRHHLVNPPFPGLILSDVVSANAF